jgi:hypothetical protein
VKRNVLIVVMSFVLGLSGVAAASVLTSGTPSPASTRISIHPHPMQDSKKSDEGGQDAGEAGDQGGPIARVHDSGSCDLADGSSLQGNWTHGDYVSAVAKSGDPSKTQQAAQSDCGKPSGAGHGGGPPDSAVEHMKAGKAHAHGGTHGEGGKPGQSGS